MTRNLADLVSAAAARSGARPALLFRDSELTWAELDEAVTGLASGLLAAGLEAGDRLALCLPNTPEFPVAWFGCLRAGLVAVPVSPGYTADEIEHLLTDSGARAWSDVVAGTGPVPADRGGDDLAALLYTSGTSGRPRGAMLSHLALLANLDQGAPLDRPPVHEGSVVLVVLPLFHVYALNAGLGAVAVALSGAAPLPGQVQARVTELTGIAVHEGYGLTGTAPVLASTLVGGVPSPGSIGRALPGGPGADGWWPTGDIAIREPSGDLCLVDRVRDLILVSGFNVYPQEVEQVLVAMPGVAEAAVVGAPHPYTGERVKAVVVADDDGLTADEVIDWAAQRLARFKCPSTVEFVDTLPHSITGKVSRAQLRESGPVDPTQL